MDAIPLHVTALVLCGIVLLNAAYLVALARREAIGVWLNPYLFLPLFLVIGGGFTVLLGPSRGLLGFALGGGILLGMAHPASAVSFFIACFLLRPWEMTEPNPLLIVLPRLLAASAILSWLLYRFRRREWKVVWNSFCYLLTALVVWLGASALFASNREESFPYLFGNFFPVVVSVFLLMNSVVNRPALRLLVSTLVISVAGIQLVAVYQSFFTAAGVLPRLEGVGRWANSNDLAALVVMVLPLVIVSVVSSKQLLRYLLNAPLIALLGFALWRSQSRGALLALGVSFLLALILNRRRIGVVRLAALCALLTCVAAFFYLGIRREASDLRGSSGARFNYVIAGFRMARSSPVFGVGPGNYENLYERYSVVFEEWGKRTAHSSWVLVMSEGGFPALLLFALLVGRILFFSWQMREDFPELLYALVAYVIAISFLSHTYLMPPYLLFALIVSARALYLQGRSRGVRFSVPQQAYAAMIAALVLAPMVTTSASAAPHDPIFEAARGGDKPLGGFRPATGTTLELKGSRGETLIFLLRAEVERCRTFSVIPEAAGSSFPVRLFSMPTVMTEHPSYIRAPVGRMYDPLIPITGSEICPGEEHTQWIWGELTIPREQEPGRYRLSLRLDAKEIAVVVRVWRMTIEERPALPAYAELTPYYNLLGHFGEGRSGEERLAAIYTEAMYEHRIAPVKSALAAPPVIREGKEVLLDLDSAPDAPRSFVAVTLKNRPAWSYFDFPTVNPDKIAAPETREYFSAIERSLPKLRRPNRAFVYLWDEPKVEHYPDLVRLASLVRSAAPSLKIMVTVPYRDEWGRVIDIFCPVMNAFIGPKEDLRAYRRAQGRGHEFWWYVSCMSHGCDALADTNVPDMVIDRPASSVRAIAWLSMQYGVDAFLYYSVNNGYQFMPARDPWHSLWDFSGNGDGTLFYPGRPGERGFSEHTAVPSIRLKLWREASYDADYLWWMLQRKRQPSWFRPGLKEIASSVTSWEREYRKYQAMRDRIGEYLDETQDVA